MSNTELWLKTCGEVKKYLDEHKKRPSEHDKNKETKSLGHWISNQQTNYKEKVYIMKDQNIYNMWTQFITSEKYKIHFMNNTELWLKSYEEVKKYIDINNKTPSQHDKNKEIKSLGSWILNQQTNYKEKINIMKDQDIYNMWSQLITSEKYKIHFMSNTESWLKSYEEVKKYIDINNMRPSSTDKNKEIKSLGKWIYTQQANYKKKTEIMKDPIYQHLWYNFVTNPKYKQCFNQDEAKPDPIPNNNPLYELNIIEPDQI